MSRKSAAVGTGDIALRPLVDMVAAKTDDYSTDECYVRVYSDVIVVADVGVSLLYVAAVAEVDQSAEVSKIWIR